MGVGRLFVVRGRQNEVQYLYPEGVRSLPGKSYVRLPVDTGPAPVETTPLHNIEGPLEGIESSPCENRLPSGPSPETLPSRPRPFVHVHLGLWRHRNPTREYV